ncbi:MAG: Hpt domain-containing protein [Phycisphaerae bacterium]|nr:Hpt domain-containing protein [Phycisphaerae bacterium]
MAEANESHLHVPDVLHSEYESVPAIAGILNVFLGSLSEMLDGMRTAVNGGDAKTLSSLAHQLKGAGGGYGYPMITDVAGQLEKAADENDWEFVTVHMAELESLCAAAIRGANPSAGETS